MSVSIKYKKFNEVIEEAQIELGNQQYIIIKPIDVVLETDLQGSESKVEKEIQLKIVDENVPNVIIQNISKEELKEHINVLNYILTQVTKNNNIVGNIPLVRN